MRAKLIFTFLVLVVFVSLGQAQTKEETIAWIKEKLEKYGRYEESKNSHRKYSNIQVSPCLISMKVTISSDESYDVNFNPSRTKKWLKSMYEDEGISGLDPGVKIFKSINLETKEVYKSTGPLFLEAGESDIHERMIKALLHLATFCQENKNEAF